MPWPYGATCKNTEPSTPLSPAEVCSVSKRRMPSDSWACAPRCSSGPSGCAGAGLWPAAIAQAEIAARTALGGDEACVPETPITILKGVDLELTSAGRLTALDDEEVIVRDDPRTRTYGKLVISGGRVVGAVFVGRPQEARLGIAAVRENRDVTPVLERLRAGDWTALDATTIELTSPADVEAPAMEESRVLASAGRR